MPEKKEKLYKIRFKSVLPDREFIVRGEHIKRLPDGKKIKEQVIPRFTIKSGQGKEIDQATYDYMIEKKLLLTKEEKEKQDSIRKKYGETPRVRDTATSVPPKLTDDDKKLLSIDKPYLED